MFTLTLENQMRIDAARTWYFPGEQVEQQTLIDWVHDLIPYLQYIPERFHQAIMDRSLATNDALFNEYYKWCESVIEEIELQQPDEKYLQYHFLEETGSKIFEGTLHDAIIEKVTREGNNITLHLSGTGGWNAYSFVTLTFTHIVEEQGEIGLYYIYDQLLWTGERFAFRLLSNSSPYKVWTIYFENVHASVAYDPVIREKASEYSTAKQYVEALNEQFEYAVLFDGQLRNVLLSQLEWENDKCFMNGQLLGETAEDVAKVIYTFTYEDPYAVFSEPIPQAELVDAAMSDDLELRVRAYNTLYAAGEAYADEANEILRQTELTEDNELILSVIAGHFQSLGCLAADNAKKYKE